MRYESFKALGGLMDDELARLSKLGDPAERVWAAWTRGLRMGARFSGDALARLDTEPNSGIRRHLIVMLAGFWAEMQGASADRRVDTETIKSMIEAMATFDPDDRVRATAWMNLIRVQHLSLTQAEQGLQDESTVVRLLILDSYAGAWPPEQVYRLDIFFADPDVRVRRAALERWIECQPADQWFVGPVLALLRHERKRGLQRRLHELCRIARREDLIPAEHLESSFPRARSAYLPLLCK